MKTRTRRGFGAIRQLPSGRYQASFVSPLGERIVAPITFGAKADAEGFLSQIRREIDLGVWDDKTAFKSPVPLFGEFAMRHISLQNTRIGQPLKPSTKELYMKLLGGKLSIFLERPIDSIKKSEIDDWWIKSTSHGARTISAKAYKLLSAVMKRALEDGLIHSNPCAVRGAQTATSGKKVYCPTPKQVAALAKSIGDHYELMVLLMAYGGFRFGEVTELRVKDMHFIEAGVSDHYEIHVSRGVTYVGKTFIVGTPKSKASIRKVAITGALNSLIAAHLDNHSKRGSKNDLLFPSPTDPRMHLRNDVFAKAFLRGKVKARIDVEGFVPHSLRHFAGTYFGSSGANLVELKEWLGDSSTVAAQRYLHTTGRGSLIAQEMPIEI